MSRKDFYKRWECVRCDLCGEYEVGGNMTTIKTEDLAGKLKLRICPKCYEKIIDTISSLCIDDDEKK